MASEKRFRNLYESQNISVGHLCVPRVRWPAEMRWGYRPSLHQNGRYQGIAVLCYLDRVVFVSV